MHKTRTLARFVAQARFADLPRVLVANCKIAVRDAFAAGFVGAVQPWAQRIVRASGADLWVVPAVDSS